MSTLQLWVNSQPLFVPPEGCAKIIEHLEKAQTLPTFFGLGNNRPRPRKAYQTKFFKFVYKNYTYNVPKKNWVALRQCCQDVVDGMDSEFIVGFRVISRTCTRISTLHGEDHE